MTYRLAFHVVVLLHTVDFRVRSLALSLNVEDGGFNIIVCEEDM